MKRILAPLLFALCCAAPAAARSLVEMAVIDRETGTWLPPVGHRDQDWIAGTPGHRYSVRLTNTSGRRVLVVLSVDGVNAVSGDTAHPAQTGYVLAPWQSTRIAGWRKSHDDIAQFVFTDLPDSYAARTRRPDHVGVIGIAVFQEAASIRDVVAHSPPLLESRHGRAGNKPSPVSDAASGSNRAAMRESSAHDSFANESDAPEPVAPGQAAQRIGTGHGAREWAPVSRTGFVRATSHPVQVTELRYDDHATLVARGVLPAARRHWQPDRPHAFPQGFVADPPRY